jgi:hypothetical protein
MNQSKMSPRRKREEKLFRGYSKGLSDKESAKFDSLKHSEQKKIYGTQIVNTIKNGKGKNRPEGKGKSLLDPFGLFGGGGGPPKPPDPLGVFGGGSKSTGQRGANNGLTKSSGGGGGALSSVHNSFMDLVSKEKQKVQGYADNSYLMQQFQRDQGRVNNYMRQDTLGAQLLEDKDRLREREEKMRRGVMGGGMGKGIL